MNAPARDHDHGHAHGHGHYAADATGRAPLVAVVFNLAFVAIEVGAGLYANSLALLADAGHNFGDVIGLVLSWVALVLSRRKPSERFTYGLRGSTILAALGNPCCCSSPWAASCGRRCAASANRPRSAGR